MRPDRAWVRLGSGRRLDLLDPRPDQWTDRDLAVGLSRTYRWGGHSRWDRRCPSPSTACWCWCCASRCSRTSR